MKVCVKQSLLMLSLLVAVPARAVISPGQNMWSIVQETANTVEIMNETVSIFDSTFTSFIDSGCDLALTNSMISVVDSKVDKLSTSIFPVLSTILTAVNSSSVAAVSAQVSVVDSKVDKLSNSLFPVLATLATASSITPLATGAAVSVVDSKVDKLSTSIFPVLSTILADVSFPIPITTSMTITTSGSYRLANNIQGTITINSDGVTLDLNGYSIIVSGIATGVSVATGHKNVWIKNGFIAGSSVNVGINIASNNSNFIISDIVMSTLGTGINIFSNNSSFIISDIAISDNSGGLVMNGTNTTSNTVKEFTIQNCSIMNTGGLGNAFQFDSCINGVVKNCEVSGVAAGFVIRLSDCNNLIFEDVTIQKVNAIGFWLQSSDNCTLNRCKVIEGNVGFQILTSNNCNIRSCIAMTNVAQGFLLSSGSNNIFVNNFAARNGTNYSIGATPDAPLTSSTDATMNYWKNYQA